MADGTGGTNLKVELPILSLLGVAFVVLKLCGVIDWSWWWVTAPFWVPVALLLIIALLWIIVRAVKRKKKI